MIVRILGEDQYELPETEIDALNRLDEALTTALESTDEPAFRTALVALLDHVRATGTPLAADSLCPSELILPGGDAHVDDVRALLGEDGLIPG